MALSTQLTVPLLKPEAMWNFYVLSKDFNGKYVGGDDRREGMPPPQNIHNLSRIASRFARLAGLRLSASAGSPIPRASLGRRRRMRERSVAFTRPSHETSART